MCYWSGDQLPYPLDHKNNASGNLDHMMRSWWGIGGVQWEKKQFVEIENGYIE